jgi:ABC-type branched-subunit amino acid transport system ATPase component/nitrogen-specific signal transduction histidine kinase
MELKSSNKHYSPVLTLDCVSLDSSHKRELKNLDLTLNESEIHAVIGEPGAGKSSLAKIISGFIKPNSGKIIFKRKQIKSLTPKKAKEFGIEIVQQHDPKKHHINIAEYVFLNNLSSSPFLLTKRRIIEDIKKYFSKIKLGINPAHSLNKINLSDRVLIEIITHVYSNPKLLILDETLAKLSNENLDFILPILKKMTADGMSILYITHRIDDIYNLAERVTIMRNGEIIVTDYLNNIDKITLIRMAYTQMSKEHRLAASDQAFHELLKYNEAVLTKLPVNLFVIDRHNHIKLINESARAVFNFSDKHQRNLKLKDIKDIFERSFYTEFFEKTIKNQEKKSFYNISLNLENNETINTIRVLPIFDNSYFIGSIITIEDTTEQENLRKQILLSENFSSVGLLAAGVAHEINNPLDIIHYYLEYIRLNTDKNKIIETIDNIQEEIDSIAYIVNNLINFSGNKKDVLEEIDINDLITKLIKLIQYDANYNNINIYFDKADAGIIILANTTEIKQAILNIMKNSFDAIMEGGDLHIKTSIKKGSTDLVEIIFSDSGPGIKTEIINNIFMPFYSTKNPDSEHIGLGLSISYNIIKKYNGNISVKNIHPKGCRFIIILPQIKNDKRNDD